MGSPRLLATSEPDDPTAVALVLHGGGARRDAMVVSPTQLSVLRMIPVARRLARAGGDRLATYRLLNSSRGWDARHTPVDDVAWALDQVEQRYPDRPVALVGHSLGGRAALLAGDRGCVRSVVALNPYVFPDDGPDLRGRQVLVVHGDQDRIARPGASATVARRIAATTDVGYVVVSGGKHAMLRHGSTFERAATDFVAATLLGDRLDPAGLAARAMAGEEPVRS